jgi:predicted phosphodiesterase
MAATSAIAAGALLGLTLVPPSTNSVGPTLVSARSRIGASSTTLRIPPLGAVSAETHTGFLQLEIAIEEVDVEQLGQRATSPAGREDLRRQIQRDLSSLAKRAAFQAVGGAFVIGGLVAALIFHRRWKWLIAGAFAGGISASLLIVVTAATFRIQAFDDPKYQGSLRRARAVIEAIGERQELLDEARSRYRIAAERMSQLFVLLGSPSLDPRASETVLLHVSDIHGNPLAYDYISELVGEFGVDGIIDTGDISSSVLDTGELSSLSGSLDNEVASQIEALNIPYILVGGNHDSPGTLIRIGAAPNVQIANGSVSSIGSLEVLGWRDPTYSTQQITEDEKVVIRSSTAPEVAESVRQFRPDILAVHDSVMAGEAAGDVPIVLSGHRHQREIEILESSILLTVGSTGATGLKSLTVEADRTYDAEILYFDGDELMAVDYVRLESLNGDFALERTTF